MNLTYWLASLTRDLFHCCSPPGAVCDSQQSSNNIYPPAMQIIMTHAYPSWTLCFFWILSLLGFIRSQYRTGQSAILMSTIPPLFCFVFKLILCTLYILLIPHICPSGITSNAQMAALELPYQSTSFVPWLAPENSSPCCSILYTGIIVTIGADMPSVIGPHGSKGRMHPISDPGGGPDGGPLLQNTLTNCFSGLNICHISSIHLNFIIKRATFLLPDSQNAVVDKPPYQVFACGCLICLRLGAISAHVGRTGVQCATSRYDRTRCDALKGLKQS